LAFSSMRVFYLFHNEDKILENLLPKLKSFDLEIEYIITGASYEARQPLLPNSVRIETTENMLLLSWYVTDADLPTTLNRLSSLQESGIFNEGFLGKINLVVYEGGDWQQIIKNAEKQWERPVAFNLEQSGFTLARLGWLWPDQTAIYIAQTTEPDQPTLSFFDTGLAQIEASTLKLHTISELYLSQSKYIAEEKNRLDRALSELLNQQSRMDWSSSNLSDILEQTLNQVSNTYVVLSGYYRVIREAHARLTTLLATLRRRISREVVANQRGGFSLFIDYYVNRLASLRELQKDLQSSLDDYQAAIQMVQGRIDVMNSRENLRLQNRLGAVMELNTSLQEQSLTFQIAASLIEFIVLAYYSLSLFKYLAPDAYHHTPSWLLLLLFSMLAGELVMATHVIAERMLGKHHKNTGTIIVTLLLLVTLVIIFFLAAHF